jgi:GDP-L-fucose synthase
MNKDDKIYIAGHRGMVGSSILKKLQSEEYTHFMLKTSAELDLRNQADVHSFFEKEKPDYVFMAAARVGGILANNTYRAEFLYDNLMIQSNIIHAAFENNIKKLMFLGSSCIYPKLAPQPLKEEYLLSGKLEQTNEPYAIAKITGIKMCDAYRTQYGCNFISVMPTNLYGNNDNYDLHDSHVLPALIRKFHEAKMKKEPEVVIWGTGKPRREFLHANDLADACFFLMHRYDEPGFINIGVGEDIEVNELALLVKNIVGYDGNTVHDVSKPDGTPQKLLDITKLKTMGWTAKIGLEEGIKKAYGDFLKHYFQ